ncbi:MAG: bacteriohemerythrin [Candidatus Thiodiazotropha sp.]
MPLRMTRDLCTGIETIDEQHSAIVDYINELEAAIGQGDETIVGLVLEKLSDYSIFHLRYEEQLMQQAGYPYLKPHKAIHDLFVKRLESYQQRYLDGENVARELHDVLANWLVQHIKQTDMAYVSHLEQELSVIDKRDPFSRLGRSLKSIFGYEKRLM